MFYTPKPALKDNSRTRRAVSFQCDLIRSLRELKGSIIERRILDSNPILEAFGNASTLRNDNSSRFGKYIELHFDRSYRVVGASIKSFLLEKTRVVHQHVGESNFHVFYQLLQGAPQRVTELCGESVARDLKQAFSLAASSSRGAGKDVEDWKVLVEAFVEFGVTESQLTHIYQLLVALLLVCSLVFTSDFEDCEMCDVSDQQQEMLERACQMLGISSRRLESTLTHREITATHARRKSVFHKPCSIAEAMQRRDCLVKLLYASLFDWLLNYINCHIEGPPAHASIGILDIYGFESFEKNSLEQLCINYANEKLQQHFIQHFLKDIQEEHRVEAIPWQQVDYSDNAPCLQLLDDNPGIFSILNEECELNRASADGALSERLVHTVGNHKRYRRCVKQAGFTVIHYARPVTYMCQDLLIKNKDNVPSEITELLRSSKNEFISGLISESNHTSTPIGRAKKKTVLSKFKSSLDSLMNTLEDTQVHYIRCIKPNHHNRAAIFQPDFVLQQLEACGLVQTVSISKHAFPARMLYEEFLQRYSMLLRLEKKEPLQDITNRHSNTYAHASNHSPSNHAVPPSNHRRNHSNNYAHGDNSIQGRAINEEEDPINALYHKQLNLTPKKSSAPNKKRLRRRAGLTSGDHTHRLCSTILSIALGSEYSEKAAALTQFGRTKLFLTNKQLERVEVCRGEVRSHCAFTVQCAWRRYKRKIRTQAIVIIQSVIRTWIVQRRMKMRLKAAVTIQRAYRRYSTCHKQPIHVINDTCHKHDVHVTSNTCQEQNTQLAGQLTDTHIVPVKRKGPPPTLPKPKVKRVRSPDDVTYQQTLKANCDQTNQVIQPVSMTTAGRGFMSKAVSQVFVNLAQTIRGAFEAKGLLYVMNKLPGAPYLEYKDGILSRRRMPRVRVKFHTKANPLLQYAHFISQKELSCSLTDCLQKYD